MPRALIMRAKDAPLEVQTLELSGPGPGQIRVHVAASGVCHSDVHIYEAGGFGMQLPMVLGHEGAGEVVGVGADVEDFAVGDHVVFTSKPACGECSDCLAGNPSLCSATLAARSNGGAWPDGRMPLSLDGSPVGQLAGLGTWTEEAVVGRVSAVKIDREMPLVPAALISCAVVTGFGAVSNVAKVQPGDSMTVVGCGGLGLTAVQAGRIAGAERIIAVDMNPGKLAMAKSLGATDVVDASSGDGIEQVRELTGGAGTDFAFDFVGIPQTAHDALAMARHGGTLVLTGLGSPAVTFELNEVIRGQRTIKGNHMGMTDPRVEFAKLVTLYQQGLLKLDELVSQRLQLDEVQIALDAMEKGESARSVFVTA